MKVLKLCLTEIEEMFRNTICDWLYIIIDVVETQQEEQHAMDALIAHIEDARRDELINKPQYEFTKDFVTEKFQHNLSKLCFRHYKNKILGHISHNCFTESENSALEIDVAGPRPKFRLHVAADCIVNHQDRRYNTITKAAFRELEASELINDGDDTDSSIGKKLSENIVSDVVARALKQWKQRVDFKFCITEGDVHSKKMKFLVRKHIHANDDFASVSKIHVITLLFIC